MSLPIRAPSPKHQAPSTKFQATSNVLVAAFVSMWSSPRSTPGATQRGQLTSTRIRGLCDGSVRFACARRCLAHRNAVVVPIGQPRQGGRSCCGRRRDWAGPGRLRAKGSRFSRVHGADRATRGSAARVAGPWRARVCWPGGRGRRVAQFRCGDPVPWSLAASLSL